MRSRHESWRRQSVRRPADLCCLCCLEHYVLRSTWMGDLDLFLVDGDIRVGRKASTYWRTRWLAWRWVCGWFTGCVHQQYIFIGWARRRGHWMRVCRDMTNTKVWWWWHRTSVWSDVTCSRVHRLYNLRILRLLHHRGMWPGCLSWHFIARCTSYSCHTRFYLAHGCDMCWRSVL